MKFQHVGIEMDSMTGCPGDFVDGGGRQRRLHSIMYYSVHRFCLWETDIVDLYVMTMAHFCIMYIYK